MVHVPFSFPFVIWLFQRLKNSGHRTQEKYEEEEVGIRRLIFGRTNHTS